MSNNETLVKELFDLVENKLDSLDIIVPYQKGNSIRIKNYAIRKSAKGFQVYDCKNNERIGLTNFKISAIALAKTLAEGKNKLLEILDIDEKLLKHYNDAVFYKNKIKTSNESSVIESRYHRLDLTIARSKELKENLDRFIF